jgi:hypothetical protein
LNRHRQLDITFEAFLKDLNKNGLSLDVLLKYLVEIDYENILKYDGVIDSLKQLSLNREEQLKLKESEKLKIENHKVMNFLHKLTSIEKFNFILSFIDYLGSIESQKKVYQSLNFNLIKTILKSRWLAIN